MSKVFKYINLLIPYRDFLYILQLEEYEKKRYIAQIPKRLFKRNIEKRGELGFTSRIILTLALFIVAITYMLIFSFFYSLAIFVFIIVSLPILTPYYILLASIAISVPIHIQRKRIIKRTTREFSKMYAKTKVIGITGSYGKTTTKYLLHSLLEHSFKTEMVPNNINTTLGIAAYLQKKSIPANTEYLIVEMGAYIKGDIAELVSMIPPDIAIITKFGDQHIERFGSFQNLIHAKYEIFKYACQDATLYTTREGLGHIAASGLSTDKIIAIEGVGDGSDNKRIAVRVAEDIGVSKEFISDALVKYKEPERRDEIYEKDNVTIIDNSYNISPQTAKILVEKTKKYADLHSKELVVMTGGIGEQGTNNTSCNEEFGKLLTKNTKRVILNPTIFMPAILSTLKVPHSVAPMNKTVIDNVSEHIDADTEVLLYLTGQTDLEYS